MAVQIVRKHKLTNVRNREQVAEKLDILMDVEASYSERNDARGWLRGAWLVLRTNSKTQEAADYIDEAIKQASKET